VQCDVAQRNMIRLWFYHKIRVQQGPSKQAQRATFTTVGDNEQGSSPVS
jgi:hypothetical protein